MPKIPGLPKILKEHVWRNANNYILDTKCPICYINTISAFNFECDHIKSRSKGGSDSLINLKAICGSCNKSMGTKHMHEFRKNLWKGRQYPGEIKQTKSSSVAIIEGYKNELQKLNNVRL